jgi:hypothetical protein
VKDISLEYSYFLARKSLALATGKATVSSGQPEKIELPPGSPAGVRIDWDEL